MLFGLAGGYALSGRGHAWWRLTYGVFAVLGVLLMLVMASDTEPLVTAHGTWIGLYAASLIAILGLACAIPQRIGQPSLVPTRWIAVAVGALCGLAWAAAMRAFMWEVAGHDAEVRWAGLGVRCSSTHNQPRHAHQLRPGLPHCGRIMQRRVQPAQRPAHPTGPF